MNAPDTVLLPREIAEWVHGLLTRRIELWEAQKRRGFFATGGIEERDQLWVQAIGAALAKAGLIQNATAIAEEFSRAQTPQAENETLRAELNWMSQERTDLQRWVNDLQSGMYINCVYCGHRYGPQDEVPAAMADVLKEHAERCPKHPMAALRQLVRDMLPYVEEWVQSTEGRNPEGAQEWRESVLKRADAVLNLVAKAAHEEAKTSG